MQYIPFLISGLVPVALSKSLFEATSNTRIDGNDIAAIFGPVLTPEAHIFLPSDGDYEDNVMARWSTFNDPSYVATVKPATETDVQAIREYQVSTAASHNITFFATGGGHGVKLNFGNVQNAINIELSLLDFIDLDLDNEVVTIGPGVENAQLYDLLSSVGKETALTGERCVNTIGPTLGGGLGPLYGIRGPQVDSLVSARLVTASGDVITVSRSENRDLFWAIRGAGANFGIVTSATYRIYDQTNGGMAVSAQFAFAPAVNRSVFDLMESMNDEYPPGMSGGMILSYNHTTNEPSVQWNLLFMGSNEDAQPWLDKIQALGPIDSSIRNVPWHRRDEPEVPYCERGQHYILYNLNLRRTDAATLQSYFDSFVDFSSKNPWFDCDLMYERQATDAALAVPLSERGVGPWRDSKINANFLVVTPSEEYDEAADAFVRPFMDRFQAVMGFDTLHVYVNEALGDEGPASWYGEENLPRLVALKQQWDPENKFGAGAPIPLSL
ncbi:hypothetical protein KXV73_000463 [Aspergillus fumigatus]|nr:hypothetical protein KXX34_000026 [Aspergillus fumigatus]KAH2208832.1 hypothetical protein KXW59_008078 [Aspergillus fumigatus]KAH3023554.1 hypothetical protein KXV73_000463 [Aspergillus fumigatus]KAH3136022.1 hypothetical protein KXV82_003748 [Aspergillus fumigatus]KAH3427225.1 hypothetical protein KXW09_009122 [Aspergillus fumigatus]